MVGVLRILDRPSLGNPRNCAGADHFFSQVEAGDGSILSGTRQDDPTVERDEGRTPCSRAPPDNRRPLQNPAQLFDANCWLPKTCPVGVILGT